MDCGVFLPTHMVGDGHWGYDRYSHRGGLSGIIECQDKYRILQESIYLQVTRYF